MVALERGILSRTGVNLLSAYHSFLADSNKKNIWSVRETSSDKNIVFPSYTHFIYTDRSE